MSHNWVTQAASLPLKFAQVREDVRVELNLLDSMQPGARVLMIASGGCNVAALVASAQAASIHAIDSNPAQLALSQLKLQLLYHASPRARLAIMGHRTMPAMKRHYALQRYLKPLNLDISQLGPVELVSRQGPDFAGSYELIFQQLCRIMQASIFRLVHIQKDKRQLSPNQMDSLFYHACGKCFKLEYLQQIFGSAATQNRSRPFTEHFYNCLRPYAFSPGLAYNPYLSQLINGNFRHNCYPWLTAQRPRKQTKIRWSLASFEQAIKDIPDESADFIQLSNILDWLTIEQATALLQQVQRVLSHKGLVLIRQLNSSLDIPTLNQQLHWDLQTAANLEQQERCRIYSHLHIGRRS